MRKTLPILIGLLLVSAISAIAMTTTGSRLMPMEQAYRPGELKDEIPFDLNSGVRADTFWFGDYQTGVGPPYYARCTGPAGGPSDPDWKTNVWWNFDRSNGPADSSTYVPMFGRVIGNGEGWCVADASANLVQYFRRIDGDLDLGKYPAGWLGGDVVAPVLSGNYSLWCGIDKPGADALCWDCGAGYGNDWCQEVTSDTVRYNGTGTVQLSMLYFNDNEWCYDGVQIYLRRADTVRMIMNNHTDKCNPAAWNTNGGGFTGVIGVDSLHGVPWTVEPATFLSAEFGPASVPPLTGGNQLIRFIIQFTSDGGLSDEDCRGDFVWGPFACDDIHVGGTGVTPKTWNFEDGLQGWVPGVCSPVGDYTNVVWLNPAVYVIKDPCSCKLEGHILELAAWNGVRYLHPYGQHIYLNGPICDLAATAGMPTLKSIFMEFDMYAELPQENGVLFRPQWRYYPFVCTITGSTDWSAIVGQSAANYVGTTPECARRRYSGTNLTGIPLPPNCQKIIPIIELISNCDTFAITTCTGNLGNYTPLYDNLVVGVTGGVNAPYFSLQIGSRFQDIGSFPSDKFDIRAPGPADVSYDTHMVSTDSPDKLADSLIVVGPITTSTPQYHWDAKMWWRVAKRGVFQANFEDGDSTAYAIWRTKVADGLAIDRPYRPQWTFGVMDTVQTGLGLPKYGEFISRFSEKDDDFVDETELSDMLWDNIFRPGTRIEYFFTSNYLASPNDKYYLPDTTGANYLEFEILPGVRTAYFPNCGGAAPPPGLNFCAYHPATLYIDAFNNGSQIFIENALRTLLNGYPACAIPVTGCTIPSDRNWDRYDMLEASSNYKAPFARGAVVGSNNGMTLNQILGYRTILVNTGTYTSGAMEPQDFKLFDDWLVSPDCQANANRQVFAMNGDQPGDIMDNYPQYGQPFFANTLAATLYCNSFNGVTSDAECSPEEHAFCVQLLQVGATSPYFPTIIDVDAYGSWCPNLYSFNAFTPDVGKGGTGNRTYQAEEGGKAMAHEQVIRYNSGNSANYKTVLDGVSWHHMTARNGAGTGEAKCPTDLPKVVEGSLAELRAALRWGFDLPVNPGSDDGIPKLANVMDLAACQLTWSTIPADVGEDASALRVNRLFQNEPNPFSPRTTIKFSLAQSGPVQIMIYDVNGRQVRKLVDTPMDPGSYSVIWDGTNDSNHRVGSGVYWSQMKAGSFVSNKKMVVLK